MKLYYKFTIRFLKVIVIFCIFWKILIHCKFLISFYNKFYKTWFKFWIIIVNFWIFGTKRGLRIHAGCEIDAHKRFSRPLGFVVMLLHSPAKARWCCWNSSLQSCEASQTVAGVSSDISPIFHGSVRVEVFTVSICIACWFEIETWQFRVGPTWFTPTFAFRSKLNFPMLFSFCSNLVLLIFYLLVLCWADMWIFGC